MKITAILHYPEFGGPHNQLMRLAQPLAQLGWGLRVVLPAGAGNERMAAGGVEAVTIPLGRVRAVRNIGTQARMLGRVPLDLWQLATEFRRDRPDVVQLVGLMNPQAAYVAKLLGIPVVWQIVDTRPPMKLRKIMMAQIRWLADVVMPIGEAVRDAHPGAAAFGARCVLFYPPVDLGTFQPAAPSTLREELGIPPSSKVVSVIGNINPQKGHEYFLKAAGTILASHPTTVFVIAGAFHDTHSQYLNELRQSASSLGLSIGKNLFFLGTRSDIPNILCGSDVFALASVPNSEGMPTVILEAMACGVPVVATDVGSTREVIIDGETGYIVPPLKPDIMADRIGALFKDEALRSRFGESARRRIEVRFSLESYVESHILAYDLAIRNRNNRSEVIDNDF